MKRHEETNATSRQQGSLNSPSSPIVASVWVGGTTRSLNTSRTSSSSTEGLDPVRRDSGDGQYVLVSVKNSVSDSESGSRRSSGNGSVHPSSVAQTPNVGHSRSSSNSSSVDPFSPTSPRSIDPSIYDQNVSSAVNTVSGLGAASLGNSGNFQSVSNGTGDVQNLALAGNIGNTGNFVSPGSTNIISNPAIIGDIGNNQSAVLAGSSGQNTVFFASGGNLSNMTLAGNTNNLLAANPGQMLGSSSLLYTGGAFLPAATSSMAMLPQAGYDPGSLLLQQQYALNPELLAASLGQTLSLTQGQPMTQNLDLLQSPAFLAQGQSMRQNLSLSQAQPTPQSLSLLQAQTSLPQTQPIQKNLNLSQTQTMLQNVTLSHAQDRPQNLNFSQAQNPGLSQAQPVPQNLELLQQQTSLPQIAGLQQPQMSTTQPYSAPNILDSQQPQESCPPMGHSFDILSAVVAANQAALSSPLQSPTTPGFSPPAIDPQLLPAGSTSGLPPSLTGLPPLKSEDLGNHQHEMPPIKSPSEAPTNNAGDPSRTLHTSSSLDNGDDQTTSGVGSSVPSSPSDSNPTSPNTDLQPLTSEDEENVQLMRVEPCYNRPFDKGACMRCGKKVYTMEKLGPVKDVLYHKTCFTCVACHTQLNLKNFHHNDSDLADLNVYCASHKPTARAKPLDSSALGIKRALTVPKHGRVNEQIRGGPEAKSVHLDSHSVSIRSAMHAPAPDLQASIKQREGAWFREQRKYEGMPPQDVVRHDGQNDTYEGSRSLYNSPS